LRFRFLSTKRERKFGTRSSWTHIVLLFCPNTIQSNPFLTKKIRKKPIVSYNENVPFSK
jgi:hypothetical protein